MSRLSELIAELCPNGVKTIRLSELCDIKNGYTPSKSVYEYWNGDTIVPWFRMEDIRANGHILNDSIQHVTKDAVKNGKLFPKNSIILATTATIGEHALITADSLANQRFTYLTIREPLRQLMDVKFFYYYMYVVDEWCKKNVNVSGFASVNMDGLKKLEIPLPPLKIQQEIVKILDKFTELQAELQAELELRSKQYEHYRDRLIDSNNIVIPSVKIAEVASVNRGKRVTREQIAGCSLYDVYQNSLTPLGKYDEYNCPEDTTFLIAAGAAGEIGFSYEKFWAADDCYYFTCSESLDSRYLYHVLNNQQKRIASKVRRASIPRISRSDIENLVIPLPSLGVQKRLANVLDNFDAICSDLKIGLPAEITLRQQQYEYYRDQLLTFAETGRIIFTDRQTDRQTVIKLVQYVFGYAVVRLGDVAEISRGGSLQKKDFCDSGVPCIHYGQIYTSYGLATSSAISFIDPVCASKQRMASRNDVIMAVTSENLEDVGKCVVWEGTQDVAISGHTAIIEFSGNSRFLAYYFRTQQFFDQKRKLAHGTKVIEISPRDLENVFIPLPSIDIQNSIVDTLNRFDNLVNDISIGLPAEIKLRQQQYEYYRDKLLSFKSISD